MSEDRFKLIPLISWGKRQAAKFLLAAAFLASTGMVFVPNTRPITYPAPGNGGMVVRRSEMGPLTGIMSEDIFSQTMSDCFSSEHHAASDCDRLASQAIDQLVRPSTASCFSAAFHAASDCDRIASQVVVQSVGPTIANCYSSGFHAAGDCDRLVSEMNDSLAYR